MKRIMLILAMTLTAPAVLAADSSTLSDTTAAAESPDASPTGHAHRGITPADSKPSAPVAPKVEKQRVDWQETDHTSHGSMSGSIDDDRR